MLVGQIVLFQGIPYILYTERDTTLPPPVSCIYWLHKKHAGILYWTHMDIWKHNSCPENLTPGKVCSEHHQQHPAVKETALKYPWSIPISRPTASKLSQEALTGHEWFNKAITQNNIRNMLITPLSLNLIGTLHILCFERLVWIAHKILFQKKQPKSHQSGHGEHKKGIFSRVFRSSQFIKETCIGVDFRKTEMIVKGSALKQKSIYLNLTLNNNCTATIVLFRWLKCTFL